MVLSNILYPDDLAIIVAGLDDYCRIFHIPMESDERLEAAKCALIWFENGCRDPVDLSERLAARRKQAPGPPAPAWEALMTSSLRPSNDTEALS